MCCLASDVDYFASPSQYRAFAITPYPSTDFTASSTAA
mgnify:CR=1 FL=1